MDKYDNYIELSKNEKDYRIHLYEIKDYPSISILAPHGGKIEPHTSSIATEIARDKFSLYLLEGTKKEQNYQSLHITSINFVEPKCLDLLSRTDLALTVHGKSGDRNEILVGGLHQTVSTLICKSLVSVGFNAKVITTGYLSGTSKENIYNKTRSGKGVQIEIMRGLGDKICNQDASQLGLFTDSNRTVLLKFKDQSL